MICLYQKQGCLSATPANRAKLSPKGIQRKTMDRKPWWPQNEHVKGIHFPLPWKGLAIGEWFCLDIWMRSTSTPRRIKKRKSCNNGIRVKTEPVNTPFFLCNIPFASVWECKVLRLWLFNDNIAYCISIPTFTLIYPYLY